MGAGMGQESQGPNLLSILINIAFGFVVGLILLFGFKEVITYGSKLAQDIIDSLGYGQQIGMFGFAASAAPYIILAPIAGMVLKQLAAVRSIKTFIFFVVAALIGVGIAYFTQGYFSTVIGA